MRRRRGVLDPQNIYQLLEKDILKDSVIGIVHLNIYYLLETDILKRLVY